MRKKIVIVAIILIIIVISIVSYYDISNYDIKINNTTDSKLTDLVVLVNSSDNYYYIYLDDVKSNSTKKYDLNIENDGTDKTYTLFQLDSKKSTSEVNIKTIAEEYYIASSKTEINYK